MMLSDSMIDLAIVLIPNVATMVLILSCLVGAFVIEIRARCLNLPRYAECADCSADQSTQDNRQQNKVHRFISFERIKGDRA